MKVLSNYRPGLGSLPLKRSVITLFIASMMLACYPALADVSVRTPSSSSSIPVGTSVTIHWTNDLEASRVDVELWDGVRQSTTVIASGISAHQREVAWTIPTSLEEGARYRVIVRDGQRRSRTMQSIGFLTLRKRSLMPTTVEAYSSNPTELDVAPMPASEKVRLTWIEPMKHIEIVDLQGTILRRMEPADGASGCVLSVTDIGTGTYSIVGHTSAGVLVRRPLIVHR